MNRTAYLLVLFVFLSSKIVSAQTLQEQLKTPPPGVFVQSHVEAPAENTRAIGRKLGGRIQSLTNTELRVHGRPVRMNVIVAADQPNAQRIEAALLKLKKYPFCIRRDNSVVEFVGVDVDEPLALKTAYEFGIVTKPKQVVYRVQAELATIEQADYMAGNPLFQQFLNLQQDPSSNNAQTIAKLAKGFKFGNKLVLRNPSLASPKSKYSFEPPASEETSRGAVHEVTFTQPAMRGGVPYVQASLQLSVDNSGLTADKKQPEKTLLQPTESWPSDSPELVALAAKITEGKIKNKDKAMAILDWLTPGKNIRYSGQTGSRYGTMQVMQQKFGHCWDFSDCFITLARAAGVPTRQVAGWLYASSGHVWAEYYEEGRGWQQVDPTGGVSLQVGIYYIPYFSTEDGHMPIVYLSMPKIEVVE